MVATSAPKVAYYPDGYPELGLVPRTFRARYRNGMSLQHLAQRLERWEHKRGNKFFEARNLHRLPAPLACELVNVYATLCERFPSVRVDFVDFYYAAEKNTLAISAGYNYAYPLVREIAMTGALSELEEWDVDDLDEVARDAYEGPALRSVRAEADRLFQEGMRDPLATGAIWIGKLFASRNRYQEVVDYFYRRNASAIAKGKAPRTPQYAVSTATLMLMHEFGHLVECELFERGPKTIERVYRSLSEALLGVKDVTPEQWRYHLVNYPSYNFSPHHGPREGSSIRQKQNRDALKPIIADKLGRYAASWRDELFAEAFAFSQSLASHREREELLPFLLMLEKCGLAKHVKPVPVVPPVRKKP